ncbi:ATP-binding protein, partial [Patescibacteria group bacterium]|nr:ATP-binding protein [Patescibacteria group bacterium]
MDFQSAESGQLPVNEGRLIKSLADSTVRGVMDAVVELVTNSDDSYARQEQEGFAPSGRIDVYIDRGLGGHCKELKVIDEAGGMDFQALKKAIEFSGETSGFKEGRSVRGFFGRGLKES